MREMSDYSGELRADAGYHDLSKETLEKLVLAGVKELLLFNGLARNAIAKRWGEEAALVVRLRSLVRHSQARNKDDQGSTEYPGRRSCYLCEVLAVHAIDRSIWSSIRLVV